MSLSVNKILAKSGRFGILILITSMLAIPKEIAIANFLTPETYGIVAIVSLWLSYMGLINLGINSAASREVPFLLGLNKTEKAILVQNVGITSACITRLIPFVLLIIATFLYEESVYKVGLGLMSITILLSSLSSSIDSMGFAREEYNFVFTGRLLTSIVSVLSVLILIYPLGIYAVFIASALGSLITLLYYLKYEKINFYFCFDWQETKRLIKPGIAFAMLGLVYNGFRMVDRTVAANFLSLGELGLYAFAVKFALFGTRFLSQSISSLSPTLYKKAGETNHKEVFSTIPRMCVYWALLSSILIPISHIIFYLMVSYITKKFTASIPIFYILSLNLYMVTIYSFANVILVSPMINRQNLSVKLNLLALFLNVTLSVIAIFIGYGTTGIAWATVLSQGIITIIFFTISKEYMSLQLNEFFFFMIRILFPFFIGVGFLFLNSYLSTTLEIPWEVACISLLCQLCIWVLVIIFFYRSFFSQLLIKKLK